MSKTVIVTGASRGIGLAIANYLIKESHNVIACARSAEPLERLRSEHPEQVRTVVGDLKDFSLAIRSVNIANEDFGGLDGIVLNHGAMFGVKTVADSDVDGWRHMFEINFFSAVAFTKSALPSLRERTGTIVYTSSGAAAGAYSAWGAYSASKSAMNALARQVACEEPRVSAFAIRPGVVDTEMQRELREVHASAMAEKDNAKFRNAHQKQTLLKPEQPANVMAKLVLDPDRSLNGQFISWDAIELAKYQ